MIKLFVFLYIVIKLYYCLNIYQQSHYSVGGYIKYFFKHFLYMNLFVLLIGLVGIILNNYLAYLVVLVYMIIYASLFYTKAKKKLVITKRIIRMTLAIFFQTIALLVLLDIRICIIGMIIYEFLVIPLMLCLSVLEMIISKHYLNLASSKINKYSGNIIAITGSAGKTTTKYLFGELLSCIDSTFYTQKSYNTPLGIAKSINEQNLELFENLILEFGASKRGDIGYLKKLYRYDTAVITSILPTHLDTFKKVENILTEKVKIIDENQHLKLGIINADIALLRDYPFKTKAPIISYGIEYGDYRASNIVSENNLEFDIDYRGEKLLHIKCHLVGRHNVLNILALFAYAHYQNYNLDRINKRLGLIKNFDNRLEVKYYKNYTLYDDSFNSNIKGALAALDILKGNSGLRCVMTPGFAEVSRDKSLIEKYAMAIASSVDLCILVGAYETRALFLELNKYKVMVYVVNNLKEAYQVFFDRLGRGKGNLLIENDLPDYYLRRFL